MKKYVFFVLFIIFFLGTSAYSSDVNDELKEALKKNFLDISIKIDSSFVTNNNVYLPLLPKKEAKKLLKEIEVLEALPDMNNPKLLVLSNGWFYAKVIQEKEDIKTIITLEEVPEKYRESFLNTRFPADLVVPKDLFVNEELAGLIGNLSVKIKKKEPTKVTKMNGILYLTSPDTGKIVYLDLNNLSKINHIETDGTPWEISFDKKNKIIYITDLTKDLIYQIKLNENIILKSFDITSMSSPKNIALSEDGSIIYFIESVGNNFSILKTSDGKFFIKVKIPPNPTSFAALKNESLIAITCPNTNNLILLDARNFSIQDQIKIEGGIEKVISGETSKNFYVLGRNNDTVFVIDVKNKIIKDKFKVGETPVSIVVDPNEEFLYVGNGKSNTISVINLKTNEAKEEIKLPVETQFPGDLEITKDGKWLVVTSETTNTISIVDLYLRKVAIKLDVGATTHAAYIAEVSED